MIPFLILSTTAGEALLLNAFAVESILNSNNNQVVITTKSGNKFDVLDDMNKIYEALKECELWAED